MSAPTSEIKTLEDKVKGKFEDLSMMPVRTCETCCKRLPDGQFCDNRRCELIRWGCCTTCGDSLHSGHECVFGWNAKPAPLWGKNRNPESWPTLTPQRNQNPELLNAQADKDQEMEN